MNSTAYRYACLLRPPGTGAVPREGLLEISFNEVETKSGHHSWGYVEYRRMLSPEEVGHYDLEFIGAFKEEEVEHNEDERH